MSQPSTTLIVEKILNATTREEVYTLIEGESRTSLLAIADALDVFHRNKPKKDIIQSIVDQTIGAKLRSYAIRGIDLGSK